MSFDGKIALVTGAGRRVGAAIAHALADAGCDIAVHYRQSADAARAAVDAIAAIGRRAAGFSADLTRPDQAQQLVREVAETFGGLDILVNSAAVFVRHPFAGGDDAAWEAAWRDSVDTNLIAPARLARLAAPHLRARRGCIVNLIDVGAERAWPGYAHHTAAKAGLAHLTRTLAVALAPEVRVNGVSPGIAEFPDTMPDAEREALIAKTALRRAGTPADVADAVVFVARQAYTTGAIIPVDGGWSIPR